MSLGDYQYSPSIRKNGRIDFAIRVTTFKTRYIAVLIWLPISALDILEKGWCLILMSVSDYQYSAVNSEKRPNWFWHRLLSVMKHSRLQQHFNEMDADKKDNDLSYFEGLQKKYLKQSTVWKLWQSSSKQDDKGLRPSFNISLLIVKVKNQKQLASI